MKVWSRLHTAFHVLLVMLITCVLFIGCGRRVTPVERGITNGVLHMGNQVEPQDLDPHTITGVQESHIVSALLEGLVSPNPKDLHPEPGAAWVNVDSTGVSGQSVSLSSANGIPYIGFISEEAASVMMFK